MLQWVSATNTQLRKKCQSDELPHGYFTNSSIILLDFTGGRAAKKPFLREIYRLILLWASGIITNTGVEEDCVKHD